MSLEIPYRLANGAGNPPDALKFMADYDWLTALLFGTFLANGGMEDWNNGTSFAAPANGDAVMDRWLYRKTGSAAATASVAREATTFDAGTYSSKINITVAGSADSFIAFDQTLLTVTALRGSTLGVGFMIHAATGSKVRVKVTDGTTTAYSSYHTGGGTFEHLYTTIAIAAAATVITVSVEVISDFTGAVYVDSGYAYVVPSSMTSAARNALAWSILLSRSIDVFILGAGAGLIVTTPNGLHTYRIAVDNDGSITTEALT